MAFCTNCGQELVDSAKFCAKCGTPCRSDILTNSKRKIVYDGEIHKCPNCGENVRSFIASCPTCGHEFRNSKLSDSVKELSSKLECASSDYAKCNLIRTFPVPNTREDILEFMILASTNIENSFQHEISEAWSVKFEQAYEKSKILFGETQEFSRCYDLFIRKKAASQKIVKRNDRKVYHKQRKDRAQEKQAQISKYFDNNQDWLVFFGIMVIIAIGFVVLFGSIKISHSIMENKLEKLVIEVEKYIENGDFEAARRKANQIIDDSDWSTESEEKWNNIRDSLLESITRQEVIVGKKIYVGVSNADLKGKNYSNIIIYFEQQGYTNIKTEVIADLITGWLISDGEVEKVTINGTTDFDDQSAYKSDAEIIVFYHTFK